jgi:hypothetical protein
VDELMASMAEIQDRRRTLEVVRRGDDSPLSGEQELARRWAWAFYYLAIFTGLLSVVFFPLYSFYAWIGGGILEGYVLTFPISVRIDARLDHTLNEQLFHSSDPLSVLDTAVGGIVFLWEYDSLPALRQFADAVILAPLQWPFSIAEIRRLRQHSMSS